jgi:hypothetical protein
MFVDILAVVIDPVEHPAVLLQTFFPSFHHKRTSTKRQADLTDQRPTLWRRYSLSELVGYLIAVKSNGKRYVEK